MCVLQVPGKVWAIGRFRLVLFSLRKSLLLRSCIHSSASNTDVGRSCILVTIGGKNIMFDCGMHMGYNDSVRRDMLDQLLKCIYFSLILDCLPSLCLGMYSLIIDNIATFHIIIALAGTVSDCRVIIRKQRRFPDFSFISRNGPLTDLIDVVIIRCTYTHIS